MLLPLLPKHTPPSLRLIIRGFRFCLSQRSSDLITKVTSGAFLGLGLEEAGGGSSADSGAVDDDDHDDDADDAIAGPNDRAERVGVGGSVTVEVVEAADDAREAAGCSGRCDGRGSALPWVCSNKDGVWAAGAARVVEVAAAASAARAAADDDDT